MHRFILAETKRLLSHSTFRRLDILYGGSTTPINVQNYVGSGKMNGALVGGASLEAKSFLAIIRAVT